MRIKAEHHSTCATCGRPVVPGDWIELQGQGYRGAPGRSSHDGCVNWEDGLKVMPHLSWRQMDRIAELVPPKADYPEEIQRLLGAIQIRRPVKAVHAGATDLGALKMGEDLAKAYRKILGGLRRMGVDVDDPAWRPVNANGSQWVHPKQMKQAASS